ncbi:MAG TPA: M1 family metallopeptidase [Pedobacter sp.]|uniref:M1 family metallopeptidase n=1 Tax=Pedobacter sp. TaxID=1411316 RepID=UPI002C267B46|nr:M1 family metallopeptidase [Pedobacter sp.]HMI04071.1 M1 family metallopeptidase [Pedobacter sp.]
MYTLTIFPKKIITQQIVRNTFHARKTRYGYAVLLFHMAIFASATFTQAQEAKQKISDYRETPIKTNELIHTKLNISFNYQKQCLYGEEWVTIKPYFNPTDSLTLDTKGMELKQIALVHNGKLIPLKFDYTDSLTIKVRLDKTYYKNEKYTLYIKYTSWPGKLKTGLNATLRSKGLFFINPEGLEKDKPIQIWTQGETESSSVWFPTIDKPNQKTTQEIAITVPTKYTTLSNGLLTYQKRNTDGTRTDTWKMNLPHAPYLFMIAVGDFKIYYDKWQQKAVDYYLEPQFAPFAKDIFGDTPEMMSYFSKILGVNFPWPKYAQVVVREHTMGGSMENTSATLHGDFMQRTSKELIDIDYSGLQLTIAHEFFHQWFGDYVTAESWSNLTVNESFADYSEVLWAEHRFGKDEADAHNERSLKKYLASTESHSKNLVRFYYDDKEDTFDAMVTYSKGGRILNMLRVYLGDAVFFHGLNLYLTKNAFKIPKHNRSV